MLRQKPLFFGGLLALAASVYAAVVYREAIIEASFGLPVLVIVAITGTATATAVFFYQRLDRFTESVQSSEKLLRDSESRFRQLFDISPFPATVISQKDGRGRAIVSQESHQRARQCKSQRSFSGMAGDR